MLIPFALAALVHLAPSTPGDAPFRQPQIAVWGNTAGLVFGAGNSIRFAKLINGGATSTDSVEVGKIDGLPLGRHRGPRLAVSGKTLIVSAITNSRSAKEGDGDLLVWRSLDEGRTWSSPATVNDIPHAAREGLHSLAAAQDGTVFLAWLDLRSPGTKLYGVVSRDAGKTWSPNMLIYASPAETICQCCHPSAAIGTNGELITMLRNAVDGSRDMYLARSADGGKTWNASKVGRGTWKLNACPMDGGGVALASDGTVQTVWRREQTVFAAEAGAEEAPIASGKDPALTVSREGRYVLLTDGTSIKLQRPGKTGLETLSEAGSFGVLAGTGPVYAAWEEKNGIALTRIAP